jgi:SAM-dependent methyltransferase
MTDMLREFGSVEGIDAAAQAVAYCGARFGETVDVRLGSIPHDLPPAGQADVITAFDVIEHLDDDRSALLAIHHSLPPGGTLVVTVPAFAFLWSNHDVVNHHRRRYTRPQLQGLLESVGFVVEGISYFNTWLFPAAAAIRVLGRHHRSRHRVATDDFTMPPAWLNRLLLELFASEARVLRFTSLPVGVSIFALARRPPS